MATHATAKMRNVRASLYTWLSGLTVTGSPSLVVQDQLRDGQDSPDLFMRMTIESLPGAFEGRFSSSLVAVKQQILMVVDVFSRTPADQASSNLYTIDAAADDLAYQMTLMSIAVTDYATDDTGATTTAARLRNLEAPTVRVLPPTDGYVRRQIQAPITWHSRLAA
jgi:hypothetical protein